MIFSHPDNFIVTTDEQGYQIIKLKKNENISISLDNIDSVAYHTPVNKGDNKNT
jgi:hypothetical protein